MNNNTSIWKQEKKNTQDDSLFLEVESFFDNIQNSEYLEYRDGQRNMAYSVVDAIKSKSVLLIEAGVGIGKSYAYLIPIIQSIKDNDDFEGAIIATSTIALQEQLVQDVEAVGKMLGKDDIKISLAKGKNNFICMKRLHDFLNTTGNSKYQYILDRVLEKNSIDRKDFEDISDKMWRDFNVRVCASMSCPYYADCQIVHDRIDYKKSKIIITNQDFLVQDLKHDEDERLFSQDKVVVIDEAHNLEEKIRNAYVFEIDKRYIESLIYQLYYSLGENELNQYLFQEIDVELTELFTRLRASSKNEIRKVNDTIDTYEECNRVKFNCGIKLTEIILKCVNSLQLLIQELEEKSRYENISLNKEKLENLKEVINVFIDVTKKDKSNNLYWVNFVDSRGNYVRLTYAPKDINLLSSKMLSKIHGGVVLTSATLTTQSKMVESDYSYYANSMGLNKIIGKPVTMEYPQNSPYDYSDHTIVYCPRDIASPHQKDEYLKDITERIHTLIDATGGKTLVLFTSKSNMNYVYENIGVENFSFPIYIQKENVNVKALKENFEKNVSSCLFATGSFYEEIDIKGSSLSQVIIAKLPFPVVDPVVDYKANKFKDGFMEVYLPEMISKLKQGTGRAIRSEDDTAVISILDSRIYDYNTNYDNIIFESLPFKNITDDIDEVRHFISKKIR